MIARTVIRLEMPDGTGVTQWSYRYESRPGPDDGVASFAMAQCMAMAGAEIGSHVLCVAIVNSLTAIARWGGK